MPKRRRKKKPSKRGLYNKRLTPDEQKVQREAAFAAIRRLYAQVVPLWRSCARGHCRRHKQCSGDVRPCLERSWPLLTPNQKDWVWYKVLLGGPRRVPPASHAEWHLRRFPASNFVH
jgi:hypothetical protein